METLSRFFWAMMVLCAVSCSDDADEQAQPPPAWANWYDGYRGPPPPECGEIGWTAEADLYVHPDAFERRCMVGEFEEPTSQYYSRVLPCYADRLTVEYLNKAGEPIATLKRGTWSASAMEYVEHSKHGDTLVAHPQVIFNLQENTAHVYPGSVSHYMFDELGRLRERQEDASEDGFLHTSAKYPIPSSLNTLIEESTYDADTDGNFDYCSVYFYLPASNIGTLPEVQAQDLTCGIEVYYVREDALPVAYGFYSPDYDPDRFLNWVEYDYNEAGSLISQVQYWSHPDDADAFLKGVQSATYYEYATDGVTRTAARFDRNGKGIDYVEEYETKQDVSGTTVLTYQLYPEAAQKRGEDPERHLWFEQRFDTDGHLIRWDSYRTVNRQYHEYSLEEPHLDGSYYEDDPVWSYEVLYEDGRVVWETIMDESYYEPFKPWLEERTYTYDEAGRLTRDSYTFNGSYWGSQARWLGESWHEGERNYEYDAAGRLTKKTCDCGWYGTTPTVTTYHYYCD